MNEQQPVVSICCTAFNHAPFIAQALDGFLMQETDFSFEILIHDDASTDGTAEIIRRYEAAHPGLILPIYQTENQYSQGKKTSRLNYNRARGRYIAICEGDDYWTDPRKLQKQVDYLEQHPGVYICGHAVTEIDEHGAVLSDSKFGIYEDQELSSQDMAFGRLAFPTLSVVFRNDQGVPSYSVVNSDTMTFAYFSNFGGGFIFGDVMGVYRCHAGGIWSSRGVRGQIDLLTTTLALIPPLIVPARRSLAYLNFFLHSLHKDYAARRRIWNMLSSAFLALVWLRPASASYLARRVWNKFFLGRPSRRGHLVRVQQRVGQ